MKILSVSHMFPNNQRPNVGVFVKERLKSLSKVVNTTIVAPVPYFPLSYMIDNYRYTKAIPLKEEFDGLHVHHPRYLLVPKICKFSDGYLYYKSINKFIIKKFRKDSYDLLDFHWVYPDAYAGLKWARLFNKKIVVTIRGNESICYFENSLRKKMLMDTLRSVDHIIAVSTDMKNKVVDEYGVEDRNVTVIPNGIDTQKFYAAEKTKAQGKCYLKPGKKYILSLCRLSKEKGLEYLLKAFSLLDVNDAELIMVGDGPLRTHLVGLAQQLNIANKVRFIGEVPHEDVCTWYNVADVYCLPSLWEGCPNVVIESIACGVPVVSTNVGGIPDLISSDDYGFIVSPGDVAQLSEALRGALEKNWNRGKIALYGSSNTWANVADRIVNLFRELLS